MIAFWLMRPCLGLLIILGSGDCGILVASLMLGITGPNSGTLG